MVVFIDSLKSSLTNLRKNWIYLPIAAFLDVVFLLLFQLSNGIFNAKIAPFVAELVKSGGRLAQTITDAALSGQSPVSVFLSDVDVASSVSSILMWVVALVLSLYALWTLFNGANWYLANKMNGDKHHWMTYFTKFSFISAIWVASLSLLAYFAARLILFLLLRPEAVISSAAIQSLMGVFNYVIFYFVLISISLVPFTTTKENFKRTFKKGILQLPTYAAAFAIILGFFYVNFAVTYFITKPFFVASETITFSIVLINLFRVLIAAPFITWARMYLIEVSKKV